MRKLGKYLLRRFAFMIITLWVIITISFFFMKLLPGTPFDDERIPEAVLENMMAQYGLDKSIPEQYVLYLSNVVQGDFGVSYRIKNREVTTIIAEKFAPSAIIGIHALIISVPLGIILGMIAALRRGTAIDYAAVGFAVIGFAIPSFVVAVALQYLIAGNGLLPSALWGTYEHVILPSIALALSMFAYYARMMRSEMLEVLGQDYIKTAKSKGLSSTAIIFKHAFRNSLIPIITSLPVVILFTISGSLVIEQIYSIPGLGTELVKSVLSRDYTVSMGLTLFYAVMYIVALFIVDLLYSVVDPRIRVAGGSE
ncbi:ABC transporter permease [Chengkuizengella sediminis]|uniref:ABC transporter permease n=1 Tax=Chengkuizengella sediminis TaxID=1885917 RepID=UPI001F0DF6D2|nr:ABC transporter permease [Chengkuizengella sediminis]